MGKSKVFIQTLGCKVNTFDSHALENQFITAGYTIVDSPESSDINVINSCSVTAKAEKDARYLLRRFQRENPDALRVITGCYAQTDSAKIAALDEVDCIVPNEAKAQLVPFVKYKSEHPEDKSSKLPEGIKSVNDNKQGHFKSSLAFFDKSKSRRTRAFVKIQDGCNGFCTYCLIPYARGASTSVAPNLVLDEVKRLVESGTSEIVFTGIHIGDYGDDLARAGKEPIRNFAGLVRKVLEIEGLQRIRISSLEPMEVSRELLEILSEKNEITCDHFHLPLQSGSNTVLKRMRRKYDKTGYKAAINMIREFFPLANLTADIIPGFPGESEEEFEESLSFIEKIGLNGLHVFPYSKRPNTAAAKMPGHLPAELVKERSKKLRTLSTKLERDYASRFIGQTCSVLWEDNIDAEGRRLGKTKNYLNVATPKNEQITKGAETLVTLKGFISENTILGI